MFRPAMVMCALALVACNPSASSAKADGEAGAPPPGSAQVSPARVASMPSESREFRDWWAVCDNGNACSAFGFGPDDGAAWIRIEMAPGPNAEPRITFGSFVPDGSQVRRTLAIITDSGNINADPSGGTGGDVWVGQVNGQTRRAVTAVANTRRLQIQAGQIVDISASGASAALLWIDERQGRLNTPTALLRRGANPATGVPQAPMLPVVVAAPAADQTGFGDENQTLPQALRALPAVRDCLDASAHSDWLAKNIMSARLDARSELWAVPCDAGAYNVMHQWFITGPGGTAPRAVDLLGSEQRRAQPGDDWPDNMTVNGGYDPAARTISAFAKARGLGDCGTSQTWTWTGRDFELSEERAMGECAGVPYDHWPTTWRSQ